MADKKRDFDKLADSWDENPHRVKLAGEVFAAISRRLAMDGTTRVLDFGCGTGLLTLHLAPLAASVTGADGSRGMLEVLTRKAAALEMGNVETLLLDPDNGDRLTGTYDVIVSCMTLHHIARIDPLLRQFRACLAPGGQVCIADLDPDDGQFHSDSAGVFHDGFDRAALGRAMAQAGLRDIGSATAAEVEKPGADGQLRRFTVFLVTGRRD